MSVPIERLRDYLSLYEIDVILYHGNCCDGFGGAWAIWTASTNDELIVYGCNHAAKEDEKTKIVEMCTNKNVIMVDFVFKADVLKRIKGAANKLAIIDHHTTALEEIREAGLEDQSVLDVEHSGCYLGWKYCHDENDPPMPEFLRYIQDRDLWKWELENTAPFTASFYPTVNYDLDEWLKLHDSEVVNRHIAEGQIILKHHDIEIANLAKQAVKIQWRGYNISAINSTSHISKLGHVLSKNCDLALIWQYDSKRGSIKVSLRSDEEGNNVNVAKIAKEFGGGGHVNAAGFTWNSTIEELLYGNRTESDIHLNISEPTEQTPLIPLDNNLVSIYEDSGCIRKPSKKDWLFGTSILLVGAILGGIIGFFIPK